MVFIYLFDDLFWGSRGWTWGCVLSMHNPKMQNTNHKGYMVEM